MQELTLKDLQQVSLELLVDVHEFCVNNNIRYSKTTIDTSKKK